MDGWSSSEGGMGSGLCIIHRGDRAAIVMVAQAARQSRGHRAWRVADLALAHELSLSVDGPSLRQSLIAAVNAGARGLIPDPSLNAPPAVGSGKLETPWARIQPANRTACRWELAAPVTAGVRGCCGRYLAHAAEADW